ncbi:aldehyde ferredoxin oxidoreductase [Haloferax mediterranei ATCC 33500]|uniref:Aldehyde ferredoxin oxidoreductase n=1 Tax=Haloferax mediterranei (strain ATCC 33500 / DSM 1411 / JCM 8866 / NBRC 14739 / NCIMB 2177 / R-4) TaxID=523841 RepID=I3R640_HALMT|nr:aldehyde ferredoxin oxidoreductase C-terminal domain-containing protein [Haloferax mediterranei]AFK19700.1 aldehyde ferredoxin oxidoreductase [Haloferax mediterranei ATCC 33500]AHZ23089.1 aldehyde:ferredoxin oxidoreductase [Haloferax mediterranei ATCC 33500]EMA00022.1 aldehyde ferredoxin oxidoreductase [Haloferax mediterranei ATCC 33500]MDX5987556.1 aldehyde ferredoxin oxidoreductase C-terminal domain-containing protein [Haloferax mediterranei ATCC 33500]QCQ74051.1 aldehyde ferredoxin oxido
MRHAEGPLCSVDLTAWTVGTTDIDDVLESYLGGRGVGTKLVYDRVPFDASPLGPENRLVLAAGPMQQSRMSFTGRTSLTGVSPLTDGLVSSNAGGFLSRNLVGTGYGAVEFTGAADELLAVHVRPDGVEFEPVPDLEGEEVPAVTEYADTEWDLDAEQLICIGPAGENEVRFAAVMTTETRAFGRGGLGAVMGSKNLKVVTFEGDDAPDVEIEFPSEAMDVHRKAATSDHAMKRQGTNAGTDYANEVEALPTRYFSEREFEGVEGINGDAVESKKYKKGTCSQCAFACKLPTKDEAADIETEGPEFETMMAFGSNCAVDDIVEVMKSNDLCDRLGMDTISCGDTIAAYLMAEDEFGNVDLIHELVEQIGYREGIGDLLAEGTHRAHEELGVHDWTVKGMDFPAHDGRHLHGQGLSFATANRGADHMYASFYALEYPYVEKSKAVEPHGLDGKPELLVKKENHNAVLDSGVVCKFSRDFLDEETLATLLDTTYDRLQDVGNRIVTLERHFNNQRGFDRDDDRLPYDLPGFEHALSEYYEIRGWSDDGVVPESAVGGTSGAAPADD